MCGIAGIMFKNGGGANAAGRALVDMLDGCQHRGPDSTGFALYRGTREGELRLRFLVGEGSEAEQSIARIRSALAKHGARVIEDERVSSNYRVRIGFHGDIQKLAYDLEHAAKVLSIGSSLEIVKDVGSAHEVDGQYGVSRFHGTHGLGHVRLATESAVKPEAAHPFWATGFADVAIVHNGQITNYWKMRRRLEQRDYEFTTDNDSELIAVYLADKLSQGIALERCARHLDRRPRRYLLLPRLHPGRDRLCQGPPRGEADDHVRDRRSGRGRLRGSVAQPPLPGASSEHQGTAAGDIRHMVTIDLATTAVRKANELIRKHGADGTDVELVNPDARHHLGVGLVHPIHVRIRGSAGYFCAGLTDAARFDVDNNVGWGVGDNMYSGQVVVRGNAGAIPGVAIRGAEIVIHGNMGSRAGQVMKAGTLACAGNANFMAGYMMYGGRIVILGDSGEKVGEDMTGGHVFVGGRVQDLGSDAEIVDLDEGEDDDIRAFLDRHELRFKGTFKKIANAGKKLRYATSERQMRSIPFFTFSQDSEYWNPKIQEDIYIKSQIGRYRIRGYGGARPLPHLADLAFRRDLSHAGREPDVVPKVALATEIGGLNGANALKLTMPVMIAPMSYGALSASTKRAIGLASTLAGIAENTGEGGMSDAQRGAASQLIFQMLGGRLGWNIRDMNRADGLEIYISQGAKPGLGGQLMAKKVTPELARIRGIPAGIDLRSPSRHPDILGGDDLLIKVEELREATGYRLPVSVKLGAGRVSDDVKIAVKDGFDFIELDGMQGSTGAGSAEVIDYVGVPTLPAIMEAIDALEEIERRQDIEIVLMGGIRDGIDAVKALCLGADAVAFGTSTIIAGGCIACMQCHVGQCVTGIATQDPEHESRYDAEVESRNIHRFLEGARWQIAALTHALGYSDFRELNRGDLVALTPEAAEITGLPHEPERRAKMPELRVQVG